MDIGELIEELDGLWARAEGVEEMLVSARVCGCSTKPAEAELEIVTAGLLRVIRALEDEVDEIEE